MTSTESSDSITSLHHIASLVDDGRSADARLALTKLVAQAPTYAAAHVLLARLAEMERDHGTAVGHWRDAFALIPHSALIERGLREAVLREMDADTQAAVQTEERELDFLIRELEAARIIPDPNVDEIPDEELENDLEDLVSETLARIYASQNHYAEAADVYETLARLQPDRKHEFEAKAIEMRRLSRESE